jgi:hypothetical protein
VLRDESREQNDARQQRRELGSSCDGRGDHPAATVATAPMPRRAIIIGSVNVIASATLAYAGHAARMITPATGRYGNPHRQPPDDAERFSCHALPLDDQSSGRF